MNILVPPLVMDLSARPTLSVDDFYAATRAFRAQYNGWVPGRARLSQMGYNSLLADINERWPDYLRQTSGGSILTHFNGIKIRVVPPGPPAWDAWRESEKDTPPMRVSARSAQEAAEKFAAIWDDDGWLAGGGNRIAVMVAPAIGHAQRTQFWVEGRLIPVYQARDTTQYNRP